MEAELHRHARSFLSGIASALPVLVLINGAERALAELKLCILQIRDSAIEERDHEAAEVYRTLAFHLDKIHLDPTLKWHGETFDLAINKINEANKRFSN